MATVQIERSPLEGTRLKHSLLWTGTSSDPTTTAVANDTFWVSNAAIAPTGISSGENFGTPTIGGQDTISPAGFTDEGVGVPAIRGTDNISPSSIRPPGYPGPDSFGNPTILLQNQILVNTSIFSLEHFGTPSVVGENIIQPSGILPLQVTPPDFRQFGVASIQGDNNIFPSGFIDEGVGIPWLRQGGAVFLDTFGIPSDEQFGIPTLTTPGVLPGNSGFLYTYYANVNERTDGTSVLKLASGDLMIGRAGYFTQTEYDYYSQQHVLIPGVVKWRRELVHAADFGWQQANSVLPGAPTNLRALTGANSAFLTWNIPVWNGGSKILGYRIYPYANGIPQPYIDTHSEDPEYTVYGLTTGVTYTFLVAAINVVGVGRRSFWSNTSTPISIAPQNVQASGIASRESFGAATVALIGSSPPPPGTQNLHPLGVPTAEHFGIITVTPPPVGSSPPPSGGYFPLTSGGDFPVGPVGLSGLASLPNDAAAAAMVHRSTWEPRPENATANHTIPPIGALNLGPASYPNGVWTRVTGRCPLSNPTTDELIQWAAAKWGLSDEVIRAEMVQESHWYQNLKWAASMPGSLVRPSTSPLGSPVFGHGYGDYAPLQNGNIDTSTGEYYGSPPVAPGTHYSIPRSWMPGIYDGTLVDAHLNGSGLEDRDLGAESYGMPQCKWHVWRVTSPGMTDMGAYPYIETSTATALDLYAAVIRAEYEGLNQFPQGSLYAAYKLAPGGSNGVWGAVGNWFAGAWYNTAANGYISSVQGFYSTKPWLVSGF